MPLCSRLSCRCVQLLCYTQPCALQLLLLLDLLCTSNLTCMTCDVKHMQ
jgi:hypothetical protein